MCSISRATDTGRKKANNYANSHTYLNNSYKQTLNLGKCKTTYFLQMDK